MKIIIRVVVWFGSELSYDGRTFYVLWMWGIPDAHLTSRQHLLRRLYPQMRCLDPLGSSSSLRSTGKAIFRMPQGRSQPGKGIEVADFEGWPWRSERKGCAADSASALCLSFRFLRTIVAPLG